MSMFALTGKVEINPAQVVSAQRSKDGDEWVVRMTDDKTFTLTKGEYAELRELVNRTTVRIVCHEDA